MDSDFAAFHAVFHVILFILIHGLRAQRRSDSNFESDKPPRL
jgi:hypothetical protein